MLQNNKNIEMDNFITAGANVPLRNPLSCPPPFIIGISLTLGFLLTYKAPIPFGP